MKRYPSIAAIAGGGAARGFLARVESRQIVLGIIAAFAANSALALSFPTPVNVSQSPTPTEKAKDVRLAYQDGLAFKKPWIFAYGDGDGIDGRENVYVQTSFDDGATWSARILLSRDAAGNKTGGQTITTAASFTTTADNNKPNIFAPPTTNGPKVIVTWTSAYCPQDPTLPNSGPYTSGVQGQSALVSGGPVDHAYYCMWTAITTDPALATWTVTQLTNGLRDAIGDVIAGNATGTGYALAWQEDPAGLQPGEGEGPGDGGTGATVSPGTNIWYAFSATPSGTTFRTNIRQASDNNAMITGSPGASRPNLLMSGSTAALAYEETACTGGSSGKCIVYHSFPFSAPTFSTTPGAAGESGTTISNVAQNARRVRFVLQGATAAPTSSLRTLLLWRESAPSLVGGAPADVIIRRGLANASAAGSSGFTGADILIDTPRNLTNVVATGGNALAQRAFIRDGFIALAFDLTIDANGANPEVTNPPTATYDLYLTRSVDGGATWDNARNLSNLTTKDLKIVVEPRIVATPGTLINPVTGVPDQGDTQNPNVFFISYATESNDLVRAAGKVYVSRTADQGATLEPFAPVSSVEAGQSEAQLRATPDGNRLGVLWMEEQAIGNDLTKDAMFVSTEAALFANGFE